MQFACLLVCSLAFSNIGVSIIFVSASNFRVVEHGTVVSKVKAKRIFHKFQLLNN